MFCSQCGHQVDATIRFCPSCGAATAAQQRSPSAGAQPSTIPAPPAPSYSAPAVTAPLTQRSANAALSLGIAGLLFANFINLNLWLLTPALMFSGGAIVWGILGLVQVRKFGGPGSGKSRTGLILAGLAIVSMVTWGVLFSTGQNIVFDEAGVENGILNGNWTIAPDSVDCPATPSMKEGNTFECIATFSDGSTATVYIKVQDTSGNITWGTDPQ